jgi:hypothetical protein
VNPLQNDWMARGKAHQWWRDYEMPWSFVSVWKEIGPGLVHATIHAFWAALVFGYWPGVILGVLHYLIDLRTPVVWWSALFGQTQPGSVTAESEKWPYQTVPLVDVGTEVRFWTDQVFHIICIAVAALIVA